MSESIEYNCCLCERLIGDDEGQACSNCSRYFCDKCYLKTVQRVEYHHPACQYKSPGDDCHSVCSEDDVCGDCEDDWLENKHMEYVHSDDYQNEADEDNLSAEEPEDDAQSNPE
jgi:hypothetical protein